MLTIRVVETLFSQRETLKNNECQTEGYSQLPAQYSAGSTLCLWRNHAQPSLYYYHSSPLKTEL